MISTEVLREIQQKKLASALSEYHKYLGWASVNFRFLTRNIALISTWNGKSFRFENTICDSCVALHLKLVNTYYIKTYSAKCK